MTDENKRLDKESRSIKITEDNKLNNLILIQIIMMKYKYTSKEQRDLGKLKDMLINY